MPSLDRRKLFAEGILIVVSILLAFAIDASWSERLRRQDQQAVLRLLEQDFEAASELLGKVSLAHKSGVTSGEALLRFAGPQATPLLKPIFDAFSDFGSNLSEGIGDTVTAVAYLLPWSILSFVIFLIIRKVWRRARAK